MQKLYGAGGFSRSLGISETTFRLLDIPADATVDGRKAWSEATVSRVKEERQARRGRDSAKPSV